LGEEQQRGHKAGEGHTLLRYVRQSVQNLPVPTLYLTGNNDSTTILVSFNAQAPLGRFLS
jgi:hypothetical protein